MKHLLFLLLACCVLCNCKKSPVASAPGFKVYQYNTNMLGFQAVKLSNNTFVAAMQHPGSSYRGSLICVDACCRELWRADLPEGILFSSIAATGDGGFVAGGFTIKWLWEGYPEYPDTSAIYITHFTAGGHNDWTDSIRQPLQTGTLALCTSSDGNSIELATIQGKMPQPYHIQLISITLDGKITGIKQLQNPDDDFNTYEPQKIFAVNDGFIITGQYRAFDTTYLQGFYGDNGFTLKTDASGNLVWNKKQEDGRYKLGQEICPGPGNTVIIANDACIFENECQIALGFRGNPVFQPTIGVSFDFFDIITGTLNRTITYANLLYRVSPYITRTQDNGYIIAVTDNLKNYAWNILLSKTDHDMNQVWERKINFPYPARPFGVLQADDGGYIIFARVQTFGNHHNDIAVIKTDTNGNIVEK